MQTLSENTRMITANRCMWQANIIIDVATNAHEVCQVNTLPSTISCQDF